MSRSRQPRRNLQIKFNRPVAGKNDFVAYIDAIGKLDGTRCLTGVEDLLEPIPGRACRVCWRLDPQLVCYSWMTGISEVAQIVFVRKTAWSRFSTCEPLSPTSSARNSVAWWETQSEESSPHSSCRTVASASRRTPAAAVPTWGFVLESRRWLTPAWCGVQEQRVLIGLTSLHTENPPMPPKFNRRRALFVLGKIDEILAWEQRKETERDTKFVELGRYLCEVRAGQYWRLEELKCFDEFLERRFPGSRRKAYYLMSIHEHLPPQARKQLKEVGWAKGLELAKLARRDRQHFDCATWLHKARHDAERRIQAGSREGTDGAGNGTVGDYLLQTVPEPDRRSLNGPSRRQL